MFQDTYNATTGEWTRVPARLVNREGVAMVIPEDAPLPPGYDEGPPPEAPAYDELAEQSWRADEMATAMENVTAIDYGDESIPGTAGDWKAYWLALRAWKDGAAGYPQVDLRPVRPA